MPRTQARQNRHPARALAFFEAHGVRVERVMSDNGSAYRSDHFKNLLASAGLKHIRTRPHTPRTNGKAERFIQTSLREWAYANPYASSAERRQARRPWTTAYNHQRPTRPWPANHPSPG
jgi:transposase InsO family protein